MAQPKDINILLLGESGVGKSTFINSCCNYFIHATLEHALATKLEVVIPAKFQITDKNFTQKIVKIGDLADRNECFEDAVAATQNAKVYNFPIEIEDEKYRLRLLDTPGIGDQTGIDQDKLNCERILNFVSELQEIHGFCLLLKPNCARLDLFLHYCLTELLSRLESSAVDNMLFIFTNSRGENFSPGKTFTPLKTLVQKLKENNNVVIPLTKDNIFCFDNEGFRYAAAVQNGVELNDFVYSATKLSWEKSANELWRMIDYVVNIKPHNLRKTMLINESKTMATLLSKPLCTILGVIQGNLQNIEVTTKELNDANLTLKKLDEKMRKPRTELRITRTENRQTVCCHTNCVDYYKVNGIQEIHYKKPCCPNCSGPINSCNIFESVNPVKTIIDNVIDAVPTSTVARPFFRPVVGFFANLFTGKSSCCQCGHSYCFHEQIFYKTELVTKHIDESMLPEVNSQKDFSKSKQNFLESLQIEKNEYEEERQLILKTCTVIKRFLKEHSIAPIGDPVEDYFNYQIACGSREAREPILGILNQYTNMKKESERFTASDRNVSPQKIKDMKEKLFNMKHFGAKIKLMFSLNDAETKRDIKNREVHVMSKYVKKL